MARHCHVSQQIVRLTVFVLKAPNLMQRELSGAPGLLVQDATLPVASREATGILTFEKVSPWGSPYGQKPRTASPLLAQGTGQYSSHACDQGSPSTWHLPPPHQSSTGLLHVALSNHQVLPQGLCTGYALHRAHTLLALTPQCKAAFSERPSLPTPSKAVPLPVTIAPFLSHLYL